MKQQPSLARRQFLKQVATGTAAGAAVIAVPSAVAQTPVEASSKHQGYQESEHVRNYYAAARGL
ncbi:twin-arginine translocation signal domain-containing protein [Ferrimonas balearica]|uniref:twin-arginine translocation signal domain-containing protein n=1 Tax=Ferrimonas balearica TaxID=44012 RepID=UPI001C995106|nr:twin-arginine translocation signal domain-containing protein [Ferrimonas balearica]MBY5993243.1 twin-arginine translocation signal domain-containing protein [Ferrimonas balearica]